MTSWKALQQNCFFFLPANADSSELQCCLERIQNGQESKQAFAGNLSGFLRLVSQHPVVCLLKELRVRGAGGAGSPAPRLAPALLVPLAQATGCPLILGQGWRARSRSGVHLLAHLTGGRRVSLAYKCVCRQGNADVCSTILAHDPFFWVAYIH